MRRLGVLGGTFDPIHEGHLMLARQAIEMAGLDQVIFLPMASPAHRDTEAAAHHRFAMCSRAIEGERDFLLSRAGMDEVNRYTVDTVEELRREFPEASFTFILGADKLPSLPYWHGAERLFSFCDFLCFPRKGVSTEETLQKARNAGARVQLLAADCPPYSASLLRAKIAQQQDPEGLPQGVLWYIAENGLYQPDWLPVLRELMSTHRFRHTLGVKSEAIRLAALHHLPMLRTAAAALLHDCAKGMPQMEMEKIAREQQLISDESMFSSGAMLHGPVGAYVAQRQFGVRDEEILNAVRNHTIGRPGMSLMELCIFVADATEMGREDYPGLQQIRRLARESLAAAALYSLRRTREYVEKSGRPFFPVAIQTADWLEANLSPDERKLMERIHQE